MLLAYGNRRPPLGARRCRVPYCSLLCIVTELCSILVDAVILSGYAGSIGDHSSRHAPCPKGHAEIRNYLQFLQVRVAGGQIAHIALMHVAAEILLDSIPPGGTDEG